MRLLSLIGGIVSCLLLASPTKAHPLEFGVLELSDPEAREVHARLVFSPGEARDREVAIRLLPDCEPRTTPRIVETDDSRETTTLFDCDGVGPRQLVAEGLEGRPERILIRYPNPQGGLAHDFLTGERTTLDIRTASTEVSAYLWIGIEHIGLGWDHLLFIFALFLLIRGLRRLAWTVTAFTVGHSLTLGWAVLGGSTPPPEATEALIALSLLLLAVELSRRNAENESWTIRAPWVLALVCGLVHGFGFAGALLELGVPSDAVLSALFLFNLGVEVGQLLLITALALFAFIIQRTESKLSPRMASLGLYLLGTAAAYLSLDRTLACFT